MKIEATVAAQAPESGKFEERSFLAHGECAFVCFYVGVDQQWLGIFGCGPAGKTAVAVAESGLACVVAKGHVYVVDGATGALLHNSELVALQGVVSIPGRDVFVVFDYTNLHAFGHNGRQWSSQRVSLDGIKVCGINSHELNGEVWTGESWQPFRLSFDGWRYASAG